MTEKDIIEKIHGIYDVKEPDVLHRLKFSDVEMFRAEQPKITRRYISAVAVYTAACLVLTCAIPLIISNRGEMENTDPGNSTTDVPRTETVATGSEDTEPEYEEDRQIIEEPDRTEVYQTEEVPEDEEVSEPTQVSETVSAPVTTPEPAVTAAPAVDPEPEPGVTSEPVIIPEPESVPEPEPTVTQTSETKPESTDTTVTAAEPEPEPEPVKLTSDEAIEIVEKEIGKVYGQRIDMISCESVETDETFRYVVQFAGADMYDYGYVFVSTGKSGNKTSSDGYRYRFTYEIDGYTGEVISSDIDFDGWTVEGTEVRSNFYISDSVPYTYYLYNGLGMANLSDIIGFETNDHTVNKDFSDGHLPVISFETKAAYDSFTGKVRTAALSVSQAKIGAGATNFLYQDDQFDHEFFVENDLYLVRLCFDDSKDSFNIDSVTASDGTPVFSITALDSAMVDGDSYEQYIMFAIAKDDLTQNPGADCVIDTELDVNVSEDETKIISSVHCSEHSAANIYEFSCSELYMKGITPVYETEFITMPHFITAYRYKCVINASDGTVISSESVEDTTYTPPTREVWVPSLPSDSGLEYSYYEYCDDSIGKLQDIIDFENSKYNVNYDMNSLYSIPILGFNSKESFDGFVSEINAAGLDLGKAGTTEAEAFLKDCEKYDEEYFNEKHLYIVSLEEEDSTIYHFMPLNTVLVDSSDSADDSLKITIFSVDYGIKDGKKQHKFILFEVDRDDVRGSLDAYCRLKPADATEFSEVAVPHEYHPKKYYYLTKED